MDDAKFKKHAKTIVDSIFDCKLLKDDVTRDHMTQYEDLISFMLKSSFESYIKMSSLLERLQENESMKPNN